jgi:AcrR family transcriptional regulator
MDASTTRSERRRNRQRQRLIDAACQIIARKGLSGLTVQDVTEEADMAVGSFYTYFPNKDALIEAAVWEDLQELGAPDDLMAQGYPVERVHFLRLLRIFEFFESHRSLMRAVFGPEGPPAQYNRGIRLMEQRLVEGLQETLGMDEENARWVAPLLAGMIAGGLRYLMEHPEVGAEEMARRIDSLLRPIAQHIPREES